MKAAIQPPTRIVSVLLTGIVVSLPGCLGVSAGAWVGPDPKEGARAAESSATLGAIAIAIALLLGSRLMVRRGLTLSVMFAALFSSVVLAIPSVRWLTVPIDHPAGFMDPLDTWFRLDTTRLLFLVLPLVAFPLMGILGAAAGEIGSQLARRVESIIHPLAVATVMAAAGLVACALVSANHRPQPDARVFIDSLPRIGRLPPIEADVCGAHS